MINMSLFSIRSLRLFRLQHFQDIYPSAASCSLPVCRSQETRRNYTMGEAETPRTPQPNKPSAKALTITRAMKAYIARAKAYKNMMQAEVADYEIGKRHLANIMGEDPESFTQEDVDRAVEYLLPSGLFDKKARPMVKNPYEIFPKRKAAEFGLDGRPFHSFYFTTVPHYYDLLYNITWKMEGLKELEDKLRAENKLQEEIDTSTLNISSSEWVSQMKLKDMLVEKIQDKEYHHFLVMMERLVSHPLAHREEEFIMKYRDALVLQSQTLMTPPIEVDSEGRAVSTAKGRRKRCGATVRVIKPGTGKFTINGKDLSYFTNILYRETLLLPLSVSRLLGEVDIEAQAENTGGPTAQAGAIRVGLAIALQSFVDDQVKEQLRLTGLLTIDPRTKERKKPGQHKARKKHTWKKR